MGDRWGNFAQMGTVGEVQMVMVLWVLDPPNVHLDGCKLVLTGQQIVQEGTLPGFTNSAPNC